MSRAVAGLERFVRRLFGLRGAGEGAPGKLKARWDREYRRRDLATFSWYEEEAPRQLVELLEAGSLPAGRALDLGCGPGVATARLAEGGPTVGLDIARSALAHAERHAVERDVRPAWVVGAAPHLPFRDASFGFVFERGTMQQLPPSRHAEHLREVARVLEPGGIAQFIGRAKAGRRIEALCPETLRLESIETFRLRGGEGHPMVHALLRRV